MEKSKRYTDLLIWQKAHNLVLNVYKLTKFFPKEEMFGLTSQLRRAAVSVPANIAEGFARTGIRDKIRFYNIAEGSLNEVGYYVLLANDLDYSKTNELTEMVDEISKMLSSYINSIKNKSNSTSY